MTDKDILKEIKQRFTDIGDTLISGKSALKIVKDTIKELTPPPHVQEALNYIRDCDRDVGFMGSPRYYECKDIVDAFYAPLQERTKKRIAARKESNEKALYERLKSKYE